MKEYLKMSKHFNGSVTIDYNGNICDDNSFFGTTDIAEDYYEHICHAINSHDELVAEVERLRVDAERYRFIRNCTTKQSEKLVELGHIVGFGVLDAMVDEMIKGA